MNRLHYCYLLTRALPSGGCMYYVGIRTCPLGKTPATDTKYMGGGDWIRRAVEAHPGEFTKTIVDVFETIDEAKALERALVGLTTANSPWSYNLVEGGGSGGLHSEESRAKNRASNKRLFDENPARREQLQAALEAAHTPQALAKSSATHQRLATSDPVRREQLHAATEAAHTPEVKRKRSDTLRKLYRDPAERSRCSANTASWWANATEEQKAARIAASVESKRRARVERERAA